MHVVQVPLSLRPWFEETPAEDLTVQDHSARVIFSKQLLNDVFFI